MDSTPSIAQTAGRLRDQVVQWYGVNRDQVRVVFAPYRICPLGAHIDHQWGTVTAMALDHGILLAFARQEEPAVTLRSLDFEGQVHVPLDEEIPAARSGDWGNYVRGAVRALQRDQTLRNGFVGVTAGRVAEGGLSSSAAVGIAYLLALQHANHLTVVPEQNIAYVQRIENDYLGLRIGILDQSAILLSRRDALTEIDCGRITYRLHARPSSMNRFAILVVFSGLRKSLVSTDYNLRVSECAEAARVLLAAAGRPEDEHRLGNVTEQEYELYQDRLAGPPARRAAHFFTEMRRVAEGTRAWQAGDLVTFGQLISQSGRSSIENYECGAPPLIDLYHSLVETDGVFGARFSGAGFRGCCLALIDCDRAEEIAEQSLVPYRRLHPALAAHAWSLPCLPGDGARLLQDV